MKSYFQKVMKFIRDEEGASAIEYGLLVALIALAIVGGATALGTNINTLFNNAATELNSTTST
jgi:pilus assembly protein Flp/PilA